MRAYALSFLVGVIAAVIAMQLRSVTQCSKECGTVLASSSQAIANPPTTSAKPASFLTRSAILGATEVSPAIN